MAHFILKTPLETKNGSDYKQRASKIWANSVRQEAIRGLTYEIKNQRTYKVGVPQDKPLVYHFHWHRANRKQDPDNIREGAKAVMDAFVRSGLIPNDGWKNVGGFMDTFEVSDEEYLEVNIIG